MTKPQEQVMTLRERKKSVDDKFKKALDLEIEARDLREQAKRELTIIKVECDHKNEDGTSAWFHIALAESRCEICGKVVKHKDL